jgi:hypothetical protein
MQQPPQEEPLAVICTGEYILGKAKAVAEEIARRVWQAVGESAELCGLPRSERRPRMTATPGERHSQAGSDVR